MKLNQSISDYKMGRDMQKNEILVNVGKPQNQPPP